MAADTDNEGNVNALLLNAQKLRRQAQETALPWYRARLLQLARDFETKASELDDHDPNEEGPDNVRPLRRN
ncbi:MAG TPA: hypothetical protein VG387_10125 [Rhizomicrobium sp.]|jgi:hypothetical protein|nr:hypothetical protein [Rhizomicrobium sp.]